MFNQLFRNIPPVVKNLLLLNVIFFVAQFAVPEFMNKLALYPISSEEFKAWQLATHFFMHSTFTLWHILFNMLLLVFFGAKLEMQWGAKRFLTFYMATAMGSAVLHLIVGYLRIKGFESAFTPVELSSFYSEAQSVFLSGQRYTAPNEVVQLFDALYTPVLGASGAIFGILAAYAYYFPNTEIYLYMLFPVKAKWLIGLYTAREIYLGFANHAGDNVAHFAHLGGALIGIILVLIWQRKSNKFY